MIGEIKEQKRTSTRQPSNANLEDRKRSSRGTTFQNRAAYQLRNRRVGAGCCTYYQLNNVSAKEAREVKTNPATLMSKKYDIDVDPFADIGHNRGVGGRGHTLGSWLDSREKIKFTIAHNNEDPNTSSYQPGGTDIIIRGRMPQYATHGEQDNRKVGKYCLYVLMLPTSAEWLSRTTYAM